MIGLMLSLIVPYFLLGLWAGCILGFLWRIHRIGQLIMIVLCAISVGFALLNTSEFIAGLDIWYIQISQFVGIMVGNTAGRWIADEVRERQSDKVAPF